MILFTVTCLETSEVNAYPFDSRYKAANAAQDQFGLKCHEADQFEREGKLTIQRAYGSDRASHWLTLRIEGTEDSVS